MNKLLWVTLLKQVWQKLPMALRKVAVQGGSKVLAPRITQESTAALPLIVVGILSHAGGLSAAARACHDALAAAGLPVYGIDLTSDLGYEKNFAGFEYKDGRQVSGGGTVLLHIAGPLVPRAMIHLGRRFVRGKRIIAHWYWELQEFPREWHSAVPFVHEVFVNTRFVADAVRKLCDCIPVHVVTYPLQKPEVSFGISGRGGNDFTVLFIFNVLSNFSRKNPCAVIATFRRAFEDDDKARLIIKHSNSEFWPKGIELMREAANDARNIEFIADTLDDFSMNELYKRADVVLSLHRAEGLGLVMAEAMLRGIPVVATNWSGNTDFLCSATGVPIGFDLVPVVDPQGNYMSNGTVWAEPHIDEAALALRFLRADPRMRETIGQAAAARAAEYFDPGRYVDSVIKLIDFKSDPSDAT